MSNNNSSTKTETKKVYVEFIRTNALGNDEIMDGKFDLLDIQESYIKLGTDKNVLFIPNHRWNIIKEPKDE